MLFARSGAAKLQAIDRSQAVIEFSLDGTILSANANFLTTFGYTLDEVKGRHHSIFVDPAERDGDNYKAFWDGLRQGRFQHAEYKRIAKGGREVWIQATYNPVLDRTGRPTAIIKFATDITTQKQRSIRDAAKIAAINRSQAVIQFSRDGTILDANENFLEVMGYSLEDIKGQHHRMFLDQADRDSAEYRAFWAALASGAYQSGEYKRVAKGGQEIWLQATYNPILDLDGQPIGVVKFAVNITEEKQRKLDLTGQIAAISASQGVIHFALDGTILDANDNFLKAMGYRLEEIKDRHHSIFVDHAYAVSNEYRDFWDHLRAGQFHAARYKRIGKEGREVWIQATYNPVFDAGGRPVKVVKYCVDISDSMRARLVTLEASSRTAANVQSIAKALEEMRESIGKIATSAARSKSRMETVNAHTQSGDRSTEALEKAAASMSDIVHVIQNVGGQINLLALNATIEAARAGAAGRGFAVVASEVKDLSGQVTKATGQIAQDIEAMQAVAADVVGVLRAISQSVGEVQGFVHGIASAAEEQSVASQDISKSMQGAAQSLSDVNQGLNALSS